MSFVNATPEYVAAAASDLANIGSAIGDANLAASGPTSSVSAAGADVVSATIAQLFGAHAQAYQAISAQAAQFHQQFVQLMSSGAAEYAGVEASNAAPLQATQPLISGAAQAGSVAAGVPAAGAAQAPAAVAPAAAPKKKGRRCRAAVVGRLPGGGGAGERRDRLVAGRIAGNRRCARVGAGRDAGISRCARSARGRFRASGNRRRGVVGHRAAGRPAGGSLGRVVGQRPAGGGAAGRGRARGAGSVARERTDRWLGCRQDAAESDATLNACAGGSA
ncbi:PE family protein [Mycobacterium shigaense]|uniref:PE family protein n=1 Tax=Mycobacterium shigaense TaxID=722731 RepID=UPI000E56C3DA|nr:PE family protein [Mycobacterium shigaense]